MKNLAIAFVSVLLLHGCGMKSVSKNKVVKNPNVIIFYVDDLGYADVSSYGAIGVETPNVDKLASNGLKFTDAHSSAATCTPSRYSLLTGEFAFRNNAKILPGDAPLLIDTEKGTLPKMFKKAGYTSAVIGKWHLGLGQGDVDWNGSVSPGPLEIGFDYSFLMPATGDRVPTVYLENHNVVGLNVGNPLTVSYKKDLGQVKATKENARYESDKQHSQTLINGVGRIGAMVGGEEALWVDEEFADVFTSKAVDFMINNKDNPFFLFFSFHDIHVPRLPNEKFQGKTNMGPRGDAIVQMDWTTGRIMEELEKLGLSESTIVIFTSDNGPVLNDGYEDFAVEKLGEHKPSGPFSGGKYSAFEAGTRVPTIVSWPGVVGTATSEALLSQVDLYASLASLVNVTLEEGEAVDSENQLDAFLGKSLTGKKIMLEESYTLSLRQGNWKYIAPLSQQMELPKWMADKDISSGLAFEPQLYDLSKDQGEKFNVAKRYPEKVKELEIELSTLVKPSL